MKIKKVIEVHDGNTLYRLDLTEMKWYMSNDLFNNHTNYSCTDQENVWQLVYDVVSINNTTTESNELLNLCVEYLLLYKQADELMNDVFNVDLTNI